MFLKKSAGAVVFYKNPDGKIEYLLLRHNPRYWNFPKGGIEVGEKEIDTAKREVMEETGLNDFVIIPGFKTSEKYYYRGHKDHPNIQERDKTITKVVAFYLIETKNKNVKISHEHEDFAWLDYNQTVALFTKNRNRKKGLAILKKANDFVVRMKSGRDGERERVVWLDTSEDGVI